MEYNLLSSATRAQHEKLCLHTSLNGPIKHTQTPVTTGTSVIGFTYKDGIIIAADTLGSYGSLARFRNCSRVLRVNDKTVVGCTGDYADFQYLKALIEQMAIDDSCKDDGFEMTPKSLHCWLTRVLYNKRSEFDPLWTTFVVGGIEPNGESFLGFVDKLGTSYKDPLIATAYGGYIAVPLLRKEWTPELTEDAAVKLLKNCMTSLFYRDARSYPKYEIAIVRKVGGAEITGPLTVEADWGIADSVSGYE